MSPSAWQLVMMSANLSSKKNPFHSGVVVADAKSKILIGEDDLDVAEIPPVSGRFASAEQLKVELLRRKR
ncbi:MAG: hypothetical protein M1282_04530 [Chloroflexi bacterium]|nr:hypothetical protein [Chloroflexota bacterium]